MNIVVKMYSQLNINNKNAEYFIDIEYKWAVVLVLISRTVSSKYEEPFSSRFYRIT